MPVKQRTTQSVTMTLERSLLSRAREAGINLSATLTAALDAELRQHERIKWQEETERRLKRLTDLTMSMVALATNTGRFSDAIYGVCE